MSRPRTIITAFALLFFSFHFACTFIFNFEKVSENPQIRWIVFKYMFPLFNQNNKVFAPEPPFCNQYIAVSLHKHNKWTPYVNLQLKDLPAFYKKRFGQGAIKLRLHDYFFRKLYDAHARTAFYAQRQNTLPQEQYQDSLLKKNEFFQLSSRYIKFQLAGLVKKHNYDSLRFRCVQEYPSKFENRKKDDKGAVLNLDFPAVKANE